MIKAYLIIDESGAKGYSKNIEKKEGEFGVMVGYLVPFNALNDLRYQANQSFQEISDENKIHITDLTKSQMHKAREIVYTNFKHMKACWFYNAIYVNGFNNAYNKHLTKLKKFKFTSGSRLLTLRDFEYQRIEFCTNSNDFKNRPKFFLE